MASLLRVILLSPDDRDREVWRRVSRGRVSVAGKWRVIDQLPLLLDVDAETYTKVRW